VSEWREREKAGDAGGAKLNMGLFCLPCGDNG